MMMNIGDGGENPPVVMCGITLSATVWDATRGNLLVGSRYLGTPPPPPTNTADKIGPFKRN